MKPMSIKYFTQFTTHTVQTALLLRLHFLWLKLGTHTIDRQKVLVSETPVFGAGAEKCIKGAIFCY